VSQHEDLGLRALFNIEECFTMYRMISSVLATYHRDRSSDRSV
jgi:hypothetical protein